MFGVPGRHKRFGSKNTLEVLPLEPAGHHFRKCGAFDLQKLAELQTTSEAWCNGGSGVASRRCLVWLLVGHDGDGVVNGEVQTDTQALGKWRTHLCAPALPWYREVVNTVRSRWPRLYTRPQFVLPGMRPCPTRSCQFPSKKASHVDQKLGVLCGLDSRVTGHVCRVTGAQAMVVSGVELGLVWASAVGAPGHV